MTKRSVAIGIGSNINAEENLKIAATMLRKHWPTIRFSAVYKTAPRDDENQADFLNAAALIDTEETPEQIHHALVLIEEKLKKAPTRRFGPRTIDLDLLLYGGEKIQSTNLTVPHPRMEERRFVLEPLCEVLDPETQHPVLQQSLAELLHATAGQRSERTNLSL